MGVPLACRMEAMFCTLTLRAAAVVFLAERLNGLGAKHWQRFSGQDYFDPRGVFFTTLVSGPLVLIMLIVLVSVCGRGPPSHTDRPSASLRKWGWVGAGLAFLTTVLYCALLPSDKLPGFMLRHAGSSKAQGAHLQGKAAGKGRGEEGKVMPATKEYTTRVTTRLQLTSTKTVTLCPAPCVLVKN